MKKDTEVKLLMQERRKGTSQQLAAARAGMDEWLYLSFLIARRRMEFYRRRKTLMWYPKWTKVVRC